MKMTLRKVITGMSIYRTGPMRVMPTGWAAIMAATTETRGNDEVMGKNDDTDGEGDKEMDREKGEGDDDDEDESDEENERGRMEGASDNSQVIEDPT